MSKSKARSRKLPNATREAPALPKPSPRKTRSRAKKLAAQEPSPSPIPEPRLPTADKISKKNGPKKPVQASKQPKKQSAAPKLVTKAAPSEKTSAKSIAGKSKRRIKTRPKPKAAEKVQKLDYWIIMRPRTNFDATEERPCLHGWLQYENDSRYMYAAQTSCVETRRRDGVLVTKNGCYRLVGELYRQNEATCGYDKKLLDAFNKGFPLTWKRKMAEFRERVADEETSAACGWDVDGSESVMLDDSSDTSSIASESLNDPEPEGNELDDTLVAEPVRDVSNTHKKSKTVNNSTVYETPRAQRTLLDQLTEPVSATPKAKAPPKRQGQAQNRQRAAEARNAGSERVLRSKGVAGSEKLKPKPTEKPAVNKNSKQKRPEQSVTEDAEMSAASTLGSSSSTSRTVHSKHVPAVALTFSPLENSRSALPVSAQRKNDAEQPLSNTFCSMINHMDQQRNNKLKHWDSVLIKANRLFDAELTRSQMLNFKRVDAKANTERAVQFLDSSVMPEDIDDLLSKYALDHPELSYYELRAHVADMRRQLTMNRANASAAAGEHESAAAAVTPTSTSQAHVMSYGSFFDPPRRYSPRPPRQQQTSARNPQHATANLTSTLSHLTTSRLAIQSSPHNQLQSTFDVFERLSDGERSRLEHEVDRELQLEEEEAAAAKHMRNSDDRAKNDTHKKNKATGSKSLKRPLPVAADSDADAVAESEAVVVPVDIASDNSESIAPPPPPRPKAIPRKKLPATARPLSAINEASSDVQSLREVPTAAGSQPKRSRQAAPLAQPVVRAEPETAEMPPSATRKSSGKSVAAAAPPVSATTISTTSKKSTVVAKPTTVSTAAVQAPTTTSETVRPVAPAVFKKPVRPAPAAPAVVSVQRKETQPTATAAQAAVPVRPAVHDTVAATTSGNIVAVNANASQTVSVSTITVPRQTVTTAQPNVSNGGMQSYSQSSSVTTPAPSQRNNKRLRESLLKLGNPSDLSEIVESDLTSNRAAKPRGGARLPVGLDKSSVFASSTISNNSFAASSRLNTSVLSRANAIPSVVGGDRSSKTGGNTQSVCARGVAASSQPAAAAPVDISEWISPDRRNLKISMPAKRGGGANEKRNVGARAGGLRKSPSVLSLSRNQSLLAGRGVMSTVSGAAYGRLRLPALKTLGAASSIIEEFEGQGLLGEVH